MYGNGVDRSCLRVIETDLDWVPSGSFVFLSESSIVLLIFIYVCASLIIFKCLWVDVHMSPFCFLNLVGCHLSLTEKGSVLFRLRV